MPVLAATAFSMLGAMGGRIAGTVRDGRQNRRNGGGSKRRSDAAREGSRLPHSYGHRAGGSHPCRRVLRRSTLGSGRYGLYYTAIGGLSAGIMSASPPYGMDFDTFGPPLFENPFVIAAAGDDVGQRFPSPIATPGASAST
jgi:hypothetical protein